MHSFFRRDQRGVALIEFAMVFPFFMLLLFGGIEISRLILIQQKLEKAGYVVADVTTQYNPATLSGASGEISESELNTNVFPTIARIMSPYGKAEDQSAIITSIRITADNKQVLWQIAGGGSLNGCDTQATQNCTKSIVNNKTPAEVAATGAGVRFSETSFPSSINTALSAYKPVSGAATASVNLIVTEVFYYYHPILDSFLQSVGKAGGSGMMGFNYFVPPRIYTKRTFFVPRKGNLFDLPPTFACCNS